MYKKTLKMRKKGPNAKKKRCKKAGGCIVIKKQ